MKIDKKIPIPQRRGSKYPFEEMEQGDSLLFENNKEAFCCYNAMNNYCLRSGNNLKALKKGLRIWMVKK